MGKSKDTRQQSYVCATGSALPVNKHVLTNSIVFKQAAIKEVLTLNGNATAHFILYTFTKVDITKLQQHLATALTNAYQTAPYCHALCA